MRFQKIPDVVLRSSKLSGDEIRLYGLLLSFTYKNQRKACPSRIALADIMGKSPRTITRYLQHLQDLDLIKIVDQANPNAPTKYIVRKDIPENLSNPLHMGTWREIADDARARKANSSNNLSYIRDDSGMDTGVHTPLDSHVHPPGHPCPPPWTPMSTPLDTHVHPPGHPCPGVNENSSPNDRASKVYKVREKALEVPVDSLVDSLVDQTTFERESLAGALARMGKGGDPAASPGKQRTNNSENSCCLVVQKLCENHNNNGDNDIENSTDFPVSFGEENRMPESEKQKQERIARRKQLREPNKHPSVPSRPKRHTSFTQTKEVTDEGRGRRSAMTGMTEEDRDRAQYKKKDATEASKDAPIPDPETVTEVPGRPYGLIKHFSTVLMRHSPDAKYKPLKKDYSWAAELLKQFNREELYEMIQMIVLDWNNAHHIPSLWPKRSSGEYPNMKYLYFWSQTLVNFIGKGIIEGSATRFSPYALDWAERHGLTPTDTSEDPTADELRARLRKQAEN